MELSEGSRRLIQLSRCGDPIDDGASSRDPILISNKFGLSFEASTRMSDKSGVHCRLELPKDLDVCHSPLSVNDEDTPSLLPAVGAMAPAGTKRLTL
jgi:hypothetical protein